MLKLLAASILLGVLTHHNTRAAVPSTSPSALEPGEAEARDRKTNVELPKQWSHPTTEIRGIWISTNELALPREQLAAKLDAIRSANFNTLLIDTYSRGYVAYPHSKFLPQNPEYGREDRLKWIIDEAHHRGLRAELWMEYGFYSYISKDAAADKSMGKILDEHPDLLSIDFAGHKFIHRNFGDFYSICPSNPKSHELLASIYAEAASRYDIDGMNLDRIRYAGPDYCDCDYCKTNFLQETGIELKQFPAESKEAKTFLEWKRQRTLKAVEAIVSAVRSVKPRLPITSYVLSPMEMNDKAQGWDLWMQKGLLNAVAVSMYGADIRPASTRAIELLGGDPSKLISAISCEQESAIYLTNIEVSRSFHTLGQFTWHLGALGEDDISGAKTGPYEKTSRFLLSAKD